MCHGCDSLVSLEKRTYATLHVSQQAAAHDILYIKKTFPESILYSRSHCKQIRHHQQAAEELSSALTQS